jgi:hypothetical protein|tara:strand:+ start:1732 stop:2226 length:495 start_codon:yes stop_codon:yes gene_type:complete
MTESTVEMEVKQFKLSSGEEILAEVVQWQDDDDIEVLIRKAMRLVMMENEEGFKYYAFRPWMVYQESNDDLIILLATHIVGIGFPTDSLLVQWDEAVADMKDMHAAREQEYADKHGDPENGLSATEKMESRAVTASDKIDDYIERMNSDSASNNVIQFNSKKIH